MIKIVLDTAPMLGVLQKKLADLKSTIHRSFVRSCLLVERRLKENISGSCLHVRSGRLRSSIGSAVTETDKGLVGTIGSGVRQGERVPYANIHETGGTIRPRISKWLTIPLPAALTRSGVPRGRARDFNNTFVRKSKLGNLIIFQKQGNRRILPLFLLKKSSIVSASKYLSRTKEAVEEEAKQVLVDGIKQQLSE